MDLPATLASEMEPILALLDPLNVEIAAADRRLTTLVSADPVVRRLTTVPGVGPVTAAARSGRAQLRGAETTRRITKAGSARARWLLIETAWRVLRSRRSETEAPRTWAGRITMRRGKRIATVALGRRLAGILYAMWRDERDYQPRKITHAQEDIAA